MSKLIPLLIFTLIVSVIIQQRERQMSIAYGRRGQERFYTVVLILVLGVFTGLRTWYNDTVTYMQIYEYLTPTLGELLANFDVQFANAIGFNLVNSILKTIGATTQDFIMVYGMVNITLYITFFRRYAQSLPFTMFLFFTTVCFVFAQASIKQSVAMSLGCWSFHFARQKKWNEFIGVTVLAMLFHPYALIYFVMPIMMFRPWTVQCYMWVGGLALSGIFLPSLLGAILEITNAMGAVYDSSTFTGDGVNIFRVLVCLVPTVLSNLYRFSLYHDADEEDYLLMNLVMLNGMIMFVGLFGTANYFARLANYFLPFQTLALPWLINKLHPKNRKFLMICCVLFYCLYFYYQSGILQPFDKEFAQISLWQYLNRRPNL